MARAKIVSALEKWRILRAVNWPKTLYFNFRMFAFKTAVKLPVFFYGRIRFNALNGQVLIKAPITRGMVRFGFNYELIRAAMGTSEMKIDGILIINGAFSTGIDYAVIIEKEGVLEIGASSYLGSRTKIIVTKRVSLGRYFRLSYESQILDSNFHYMLDVETNEIPRLDDEVIINDYCWIGNRTTILKSTKTPSYLTVASNSLLNKDYTRFIKEKSLIGGIPAKLIRTNVTRVYDPNKEMMISEYFRSHPDEQVFRYDPDFFH